MEKPDKSNSVTDAAKALVNGDVNSAICYLRGHKDKVGEFCIEMEKFFKQSDSESSFLKLTELISVLLSGKESSDPSVDPIYSCRRSTEEIFADRREYIGKEFVCQESLAKDIVSFLIDRGRLELGQKCVLLFKDERIGDEIIGRYKVVNETSRNIETNGLIDDGIVLLAIQIDGKDVGTIKREEDPFSDIHYSTFIPNSDVVVFDAGEIVPEIYGYDEI